LTELPYVKDNHFIVERKACKVIWCGSLTYAQICTPRNSLKVVSKDLEINHFPLMKFVLGFGLNLSVVICSMHADVHGVA